MSGPLRHNLEKDGKWRCSKEGKDIIDRLVEELGNGVAGAGGDEAWVESWKQDVEEARGDEGI